MRRYNASHVAAINQKEGKLIKEMDRFCAREEGTGSPGAAKDGKPHVKAK